MEKTTFEPKHNRLSYGELLSPPPEFVLEKAVCTTYSLDLQTLVASTIALGLGEATDSELAKSPINLLYALQKVTDKMLVFCDSSHIYSIEAKKRNRFFGLLEKTVVPVSLPKKSKNVFPSFHPKCWIVQYKHVEDSTKRKYKFIILSRNLTFDRSWDISCCLDGIETNNHIEDIQTQRLIGFITFLKSQINSNDPDQEYKYQFINELIKNLSNVKFSTDDTKFTDFEILPIGTGQYDINQDSLFSASYVSKICVMSPFVSKSVIKRLLCRVSGYYTQNLITRESELPKIKSLTGYFKTYCLKDYIVDGEDIISESDNVNPMKEDIHAKIYFMQTLGGEKTLYIGSMNASENGANRNVELLLKLKANNYSPDDFINEIKDDYLKQIDLESISTDVMPDKNNEFDNTLKHLCRLDLSADVINLNDANYNVEISIPNYTDNGLKLQITPFFAKGISKDISSFFVIEGLSLGQLSEFYIITDGENERIIKIPTDNMPEGRERNIITSIISSKKKLSEYIAFVLGDDVLSSFADEVLDIIDGDFEDGNNTNKSDKNDDMIPIYERMLKTSVTNPDRLKEIESIIQMIDDESIVTPDFKKLYETFKNTLKL
ncbi:MAG: hypothetical protein IKQ70_14845 [Bacteroidales bacterium]|nr:hypothetical protein [Bacteroidales bacterium]